MGSAAIALAKPRLSDLLELVGFPSKASDREKAELASRTNELVRTVAGVIDDLVTAMVEKRTAEDFRKIRDEVFSQYFQAMRALSDLARIVIPKQTINRLSAEWFSELEADFRERGPAAFGTDLTERGIFTVWMLRKIHDLGQEVSESPVPRDQIKDREMALDFSTKAMWTRLHIDCLTKSMNAKVPIYPDVVDTIRDGLRAAVNTYAAIREWCDLRSPRSEQDFPQAEWTEEDEILLADSMHDLEQESEST